MIREVIKNRGNVFVLTWRKAKNFSRIKPVTQVYGVCFDKKGRILIVNTAGNWCLPGGTPEKSESFEETLKREALEEGDVEIYDLRPLGYQKVWSKEKSGIYQLRYFARVSR
ncbi:MAG: NUDIX hydrolase, partial [Candidatus Pacearchaeota archaeon]|nr:NUDIX hydrolase [Candidatus Pacearchaeota archaeon]